MRIFLACPAPPRSLKGNRVTALRWGRIFKELGHRLVVAENYRGQRCDLMIALHARKSFAAVQGYRQEHPTGPLVVALTGTDLYRDLPRSRQALQALEMADRIVVLQPLALKGLPAHLRPKARVVYQSAVPANGAVSKNHHTFDVCVLGHLRQEKDPLRTALALRMLPQESTVRVTHAGQALTPALARQARAAMARDGRYRWLGELPRWQARRLLARSHLLVLSSRLEGGANVVSEAVALGVPMLASRIDGNVGLLGAAYPGFFSTADTRALAELLRRAAKDSAFYEKLRTWCAALAPRFEPRREKEAWKELLAELEIFPCR